MSTIDTLCFHRRCHGNQLIGLEQMSAQPPPYIPHPQTGPTAPGFNPALSTQPSAFPGSSYQTFPQSYPYGGDHSYYHGPPGHMGPPGAYHGQPGYQGYHGGPHGGPHCAPHGVCGEQPKHTVFVVEQRHDDDDGDDCFAACTAALCCCCLMDMMDHDC
ncbi:uncharacterized protein V6R79_017468 [Siganus canaliculatus]